MNQDWDKWGRDISDMVQDAVNSRNFSKLNQSINHTIQDALNSVQKGMENVGRSADRAMGQAADEIRRKTEARPVRRPPKVLFARKNSLRAGGTALAVCGLIFGCGLGLALVITGLVSLVGGIFSVGVRIAMAVMLPLFLGSAAMAVKGKGMVSEVKRFQTYIETLRGKTYCDIRELADRIGKSNKFVIKDIRRMIQKGWFLEGHLDDEESCLMVSHETFEAYEELKKREAQQIQAEPASTPKQTVSQENAPTDEAAKVIAEGSAYIQKIHDCNDAIPGEEISRKISRMEMLVRRIFDRVKQNPESIDDIRKLMVYYLPTTVKLLEAYKELDAQPVNGENIAASKREIERTLDTLNMAFEKLLDSLFEDVAWDVSSDISVLQTMLAQEGLTGNDFKGGGQKE